MQKGTLGAECGFVCVFEGWIEKKEELTASALSTLDKLSVCDYQAAWGLSSFPPGYTSRASYTYV